MLIDSHVNLHSEAFDDDREAVLVRAREAGIAGMLTICDRLDHLAAVRAMAVPGAAIWASVGVHPHHAKDFEDLVPETLIAHASDDRIVAIGECGLDRHYEYSPLDVQERVFRAHARAAARAGLPLIIHAREADADVARVLADVAREEGGPTPLLHCYTGGPDLLRTALDLGGYVAFSGIAAFKKADAVRAMVKLTPLDRLLLETDCPYLAPPPYRGRRNEPAFLPQVAACVAAVHGVPVARVEESSTDAFFRLFTRCDRAEAEAFARR